MRSIEQEVSSSEGSTVERHEAGTRKRITFIGINYSPEPLGVAPYATRFCSSLADRGYDVSVITGVPHYPQWRTTPEYRWKFTAFERIDGVPVKRVRHLVPGNPTNGRRLLMEVSFGLRAALSSWQRPDILVCTSPALVSTALVCLRHWADSHHRPALGLWVHDLYAVGLSETQKRGSVTTKLVAQLESRALNHADAIAVLTDRFRQQLVQNLRVDPAKITKIPNWNHIQPTVVADRGAVRADLGWSDDEIVVLHAGNMGVKQGLHTVVRAAQLATERGVNVRFVLLGDGNQRRSLEEMAAGASCLEFRDPVPEEHFPSVLAAADILLLNEMPGVSDMSIPSKLTSYFQSGIPVLAATDSTSTAAAEMRKSGAGDLVDGGDPEALVDAVVRMSLDATRRAQQGARGVEYVAAELSEQASLEKFDRWIEQLAQSKAR